MKSYRHEIDMIISTYKSGLITFEECLRLIIRQLEEYKVICFSQYENITEEKMTFRCNKLRLYALTNLISAVVEMI